LSWRLEYVNVGRPASPSARPARAAAPWPCTRRSPTPSTVASRRSLQDHGS